MNIGGTPGYGVAFSPDGKAIASCASSASHSGTSINEPQFGTVKIWEATTGTEAYSFRATTNDVYDLAFSPDGKLLALATGYWGRNWKSGGHPGAVQRWDWKTSQRV